MKDSSHYFLHCPFYATQRRSLFKYMNDTFMPITSNNLFFGTEKLILQNSYCYLIKSIPISELQTDSSEPSEHVYTVYIFQNG